MRRTPLVCAMIAILAAAGLTSERTGRAFYDAGLPGLAALVLHGPAWRGATLYAQGDYAGAAAAFADAPFGAADYDEGTALARAGKLDQSEAALNEALYRDPNDEDARYNLALVEALKARKRNAPADADGAANANASKQKRGGEAPTSAENDVNSTGEGAAGDRDSGRQASSPGRAAVSKLGRAQQSSADDKSGEARGAVSATEGAGRKGGDNAKVAQSFEDMVKLPKMSFSQQAVQPSRQWLETIPDDPGRYIRLKLTAERTMRAERGVAAPEGTDQW